jgi:hypothetical protein
MSFYKEIENYFLQLRGRLFGLSSYNLLSPKEIHLIKEWKQNDVPMKVIKSGIEESLKRYLENYPSRRDEPPSLLYCKPTISKHFRRLKETRVGARKVSATSGEPATDYHQNLISRLTTAIIRIKEELTLPEKRAILKAMETSLKLLQELKASPSGKEELNGKHQEMKPVMEILEAELFKLTPFTIKKRFVREVSREIREYRTKMKPDAYRETRNTLVSDYLREFFFIDESS